MSTPEFPSILNLLFDSYQIVYENKVARSEFESGIVKQRKIQCRSYKVHNAVYAICGQDGLNTFYNWLNGDINGGADWFLWPDPTNDGQIVRGRLRSDGIRVTPQSKEFNSWQVSLAIEVWAA